MDKRHLIFFASDVHLGLDVKNPVERENEFVRFLRAIPKEETAGVYLLGDIWDFWYEYHDVVPKGYVRVFSALMDLIGAGVEVYFIKGNHDAWCFRYFQEMGIHVLEQPYLFEMGGKKFCIGHGDGLGPGMGLYKFMKKCFNAYWFRRCCGFIHPRIVFWFATGWSRKSKLARNVPYQFRGVEEPLYKWADEFSRQNPVDYILMGHYHTRCEENLPSGARLMILKDWVDQPFYLNFDGMTGTFGYFPNME